MAIFASKNVLTAAGHIKCLDALYAHFNHASAATHWDVIDADAGVAGGAAVNDEYFVVRSKHATISMDVKMKAKAAGLCVEVGWKNGWTGVNGNEAGWGGAANTGEKVIFNDNAALCEMWIMSDVGTASIIIDVDRNGTIANGFFFGPYTAFEDLTVDQHPKILLVGYPNTDHADSILDGDHAWTLGHDGNTTVSVKKAGDYTYTVGTSRFSGLAIPMPIVLNVTTGGFTAPRGTLNHAQYVPDRAAKDTLNSKAKIIWNDLAFDWDGSVPA